MSFTFFLVLVAWVFFRAETNYHAINYLSTMFSPSLFTFPEIFPGKTFIVILFFLGIEWLQRDKDHALQIDAMRIPRAFRWSFYYVILLLIFSIGGEQQEFIYFQF